MREDGVGVRVSLQGDPDLVAHLLEGMTDAFFALDQEGRFTYINRHAETLWGMRREDLLGRSALECFPQLVGSESWEAVQQAVRERRTVSTEAVSRVVGKWVHLRAYPLETGVAVHFHDITDRKEAEARTSSLAAQLRSVLDSAGEGIYGIDREGLCTFINPAAAEMLGYDPKELVGRNMHEAVHHTYSDGSPFPEGDCPIFRAFRLGNGARVEDGILWRKDKTSFPARYSSHPIASPGGPSGAVVVFSDTTERRRAEEALRRSEERYRTLASATSSIVWMADAEGKITEAPSWGSFTGQTPAEYQGTGWLDAVHPEDRSEALRLGREAIAESRVGKAEFRLLHVSGEYRHVSAYGVPLVDEEGQVREWIGTVTDIHERKQAEERIREQARTLGLISKVGASLSAELRLEPLLQSVVDVSTELSRAEFGAFFYNAIDEHGESYSLYTLSGAPREAFSNYPMPRNTHVFGPTFRGEGVIRLADVTQDARFGQNPPYYGMPEGHLPVRSYLAVPVVSRDGSVLGGLFFGHSEPGVFTEQAEEIVRGIAGQAATAIDNARLYERQEVVVQERTAQLVTANKELEAFTYSVSHDLRAPLRGIEGFSRVLEEDYADLLGDQGRRYTERIRAGAAKMGVLIDALLALSQLHKQPMRITAVDLSRLAAEVCESLWETEPDREVDVVIEPELVAQGDESLLRLLLENLLGNAWKFTRDNPSARIEFRRAVVGSEAVYLVADNGAGFDMAYAGKLFTPFQRLHSHDSFSGTGIGLSIVQRVVHRHGGKVWGESRVGEGARFYFSLAT